MYLTFYDEFPFDFTGGLSFEELAQTHPPLLRRTLQELPPESKVLDIGCGSGRAIGYAVGLGLRPIGLDISLRSLQLMQQRYQQPAAIADNVNLPLASNTADFLISDGVIHHTLHAQQSLKENARVLKTGGEMYLAVYKPRSHYYYLYRYLGRLLRVGAKFGLVKRLIETTLLPAYYLVHKFKSGGKRDWAGAKNLFYDYFITPRVSFHSKAEILDWCHELGLCLLQYHNNPRGNVHLFLLQKM